jgi:hypothetical protein
MKSKDYNMLLKILRQKQITILVCLISCVSFGQTNEETRKRADDFFESENYIEATKDYLHLLSLEPTDADLNFRYGTCLLFNSNNKNKALRYLNYAVRNATIDPRAFFFNGKALHLDYQFENAKNSYLTYQEKRAKKDDRYKVELAIKMCDNGKKLLSTFTDIIVTNKQEISSENFFKIYSDSKTIGGEILVVAKFQSKIDKKMNHVPVVHFPPNAKAIYYSSYGEGEDTGLDIYVRRKLPDGSWGDPQLLPGQVNTNDNEDFPYMHPSGKFLYFSSTGHNSMGGYDVFMSRLNTETNSFFTPENVDFAISSPDDDLFYVVDSLFQNAYFASARQSEDGKYHVYKVKVARVPIQEIIVMGDFISEINPNNETMRITLTSNSNGSEVGKIVSNEKGKYSFVFPKGGKYNYEITVDGNENNTYKYLVDLPFLDEFRPLKQKAIHKMVDGQEIVTIINLFDETVEGAEAMIAEVIRKKAVLEVNVDKFDLKELELAEERNKILAEVGFNNMSVSEISERLNDIAKGEDKRSEMVERIESNLDLAVISKSEELVALNAELEEILAKVEQTSNPVDKHALLMEAKNSEAAISQLNSEMAIIGAMKNEVIQTVGAPSTSGVRKIEVIENQFNALISAGKEDDALALLIKNKDFIQKAKDESIEKYIAGLVEKSVNLNEDLKKLKKQQVDFELNDQSLEAQINQLSSQLLDAKKKDAEQIKSQIADKEAELVMVKELLLTNKNRIIEKNTELDALNNTIETLQKAMSNTDLAAYKKEDVDSAVKKSKNIENEVISKKIDSQINEIESNNPELNPDYQAVDLLENSLAEIKDDYNEKISEIKENSNLSAVERLNLEQKVNNENTAKINNRINSNERKLEATPNNEGLTEELNELNAFKEAIEQENVRLANELSALNSTTSTNDLVAIQNKLNQKIEAIQSDNSFSKENKAEEQEKANNESLAEISKRLMEIDQQLKNDPQNVTLTNEKAALQEYKVEIEEENKRLATELLALMNTTVQVTQLKTIENELNQKIESIQANNSTTEEQKINAKQQANNESINQIDKRINTIEAQLSNEPDNTELLEEQLSLIQYKTIVEQENATLAGNLVALDAANSKETPTTGSIEEVLTSVQADYQDEVAAIKANNVLSEIEQLNQLQALDDKLILALQKENASNDKLLKKRSDDKTLLSKKEALNELIAQKQNEVEERAQTINAKNKVSSVIDVESLKTELLTAINPNYESEKSEINSSNSSEFKKIEALLTLEIDQLSKLENKKNAIEKALKLDPTDEKLTAENQAIDALIEVQKRTTEELKSSIAKTISADAVKEKVTEIDETYYREIAVIAVQSMATKANSLKAREVELQENLVAAIAEKEKALSRSYSVTVELEKAIFEKALTESREREANATNSVSSTTEKESFIAEVRSTNKQPIENALNSNPTTKTELEKADTILESYENELTERLQSIEKEMQSSPSDELKAQKEWLENELDVVQQKRRSFSVSIGELETNVVANTSDAQIEKLTTELVENQKENKETSDALKIATEVSPTNKSLISANEYNTTKQAEIDALRERAEKEESPEEKVKLLNEATIAQKELNTALNEVIAENKIKVLENEIGLSLLTEEELTKLKRKFSVKIGELTTEIEKVDEQIKVTSGNDQIAAQQKKENLIREKSLLELRLEELMRNRASQRTEVEPVVDSALKSQTVSLEEQTEIASNVKYEKYYTSATEAIALEKVLNEKITSQTDSKSELVKMIESGASLSSAEVKAVQAKINADETAIKTTTEQFNQTKIEANSHLPNNTEESLKMKTLVAQGVAPKTSSTVIANNDQTNDNQTNNNQTNDNTEFIVHKKENIVEKTMIPVGVENKSGLVYRVQVGAYSKPIPSTLFVEFDPVTGEVIKGSSIIRYMAGYFSTSDDAYNAQAKIRGFGYRDAFVVAYCNGQRISIGEARKTQADGSCVSNGESNFNLGETGTQTGKNTSSENSVQSNSQKNSQANSQSTSQGNSQNTSQTSSQSANGSSSTQQSTKTQENNNSDVKRPKDQEEVRNNKSNAANSSEEGGVYFPVEGVDGLLYRVQIGVYRGFVGEKYLHGMQEIVSMQLPEGQVRYSSGSFDSVEKANPRRIEAIEKGVKGAFVTAYYNGERISIAESKRLLEENGVSILHSVIEAK